MFPVERSIHFLKHMFALVASDADEDVEQQEFTLIADGNAEWYIYLEDGLVISYKTKRVFPCDSAVPLLKTESKYISLHKLKHKY